MESFVAACQDRWGDAIRIQEPLARHGTFAVGGPADVWFNALSEDDLLAITQLAHGHDVPLMFVGNGTNVLYSGKGARGAVVRVSIEAWELRDLDEANGTVSLVAGAGVNLPRLVNDLSVLGWAGLEWGAGVPGTIGGGVVSNAGCHGMCIGDTLIGARVLDAREPAHPVIRELPAADLELAYRHSRFRAGRHVGFGPDDFPQPPSRSMIDPVEVITCATFRLRKEDPAVLRERIASFKQHRKDTQPPQPSAGSVFKNPPGDYAGRLVEAAGLRGYQIGNAAISTKHANFIVNLGGATVDDIVNLITLAHRTVQSRFGINLELEVEPRGDW
jgi:UDP-N-acetylmuramate dehydrogenase